MAGRSGPTTQAAGGPCPRIPPPQLQNGPPLAGDPVLKEVQTKHFVRDLATWRGPRRAGLAWLLPLFAWLAPACGGPPDVVLYCALDEVHSEPLIAEFERRTGLDVDARYDVEAHKTVGLVRAIREEAARPRCDVFWNNEIANTIALAGDGLLQSYDSPSAADIPAEYRDPERRWTAFAARARVFIYNTERVEPGALRGMWDLVDPKWKGQSGMARPLTGTTLTHMAALFSVLGEEEARRYLEAVKAGGVSLTGGNMTLAKLVASGELAFGWTDTDDYNVMREKGRPVGVVYPDDGGMGTLLIPNSVAILKDAPHPEAARRLVDYILSEEVEAQLARSRSAQIPVRESVRGPESVKHRGEFSVMSVDYAAVGAQLAQRSQLLREMFLD